MLTDDLIDIEEQVSKIRKVEEVVKATGISGFVKGMGSKRSKTLTSQSVFINTTEEELKSIRESAPHQRNVVR